LFSARYIFGSIQPRDDISELRFFPVRSLRREEITPEHRPLYDLLQRSHPELGSA
jgi:hypothetical protein